MPSSKAKSAARRPKTAAKAAIKPRKGESANPAPGKHDDAIASEAKKLASTIQNALSKGELDVLSPETLQDLMAALCRTYSAQVEAGREFLPLRGRTSVSSTDIMTTASGLLKSANLAVFELGMWQSWTGR
jgi:hypothetical protein